MSHPWWSYLTASSLHRVQLDQCCGAQGSPRAAEPQTYWHPTWPGSASLSDCICICSSD